MYKSGLASEYLTIPDEGERWKAPETTDPSHKDATPAGESKEADVYAFGMVGAEVFTGKVPFEGMETSSAVSLLQGGGRPEMPEDPKAVGLNKERWGILQRCWEGRPGDRPKMPQVVIEWELAPAQKQWRLLRDVGRVCKILADFFLASAEFLCVLCGD